MTPEQFDFGSVWIALWPSPPEARSLALRGGVPFGRLHLTLAFVSTDMRDHTKVADGARRALSTVAQGLHRIHATLGKMRSFQTPQRPRVVEVRTPDGTLERLRARLVEELAREGIAVDATHPFVPHISLAFGRPRKRRDRGRRITFTKLRLVDSRSVTTVDFVLP